MALIAKMSIDDAKLSLPGVKMAIIIISIA